MSDHQKLCYGCNLLLNVSNFAYCWRSKDKLKKHCHVCATKGDRPVEAGEKMCAACAKHLPRTNFSVNTRTRDGLRTYCRVCASRMNCDGNKKRRSIILQILKSELGCRMCGEKDWRVLEADHIDRATKGRSSSGKPIKFQGMPMAKLLAELVKAQFLCGWLYPPLILHCLSQYFCSRLFLAVIDIKRIWSGESYRSLFINSHEVEEGAVDCMTLWGQELISTSVNSAVARPADAQWDWKTVTVNLILITKIVFRRSQASLRWLGMAFLSQKSGRRSKSVCCYVETVIF